ncbi:MAG: ABC transporter substrate-binding protein [Burkholderiaceae bacterium]
MSSAWRRWLVSAAAGAWLLTVTAIGASADRREAAAAPVRIALSCGALGIELRLCEEGARAWSRRTGHEVSIVSTPNSSTERFALYLQLLASRSPDIDVLQIDIVWTGVLASHLIDLRAAMGEDANAHFPALIANDTIGDRLVAMPWWIDAGVLYYRRDLLERHGFAVPTSWQALTETASVIQQRERERGNARLWGFVWQGRPYEGLTCNALEWLDAFGGGALLADDGSPNVANAGAVAALTLAARWVGHISPPGVLTYDEEAARGVFQSGHAVFMRNWPYAWALLQHPDSPVRNRVGVAALPGNHGRATGTLGGWHLAVSRHSRHPEIAADLVRHLTSPAEQKRRALAGAYNPSIPALYRDADVLAANPFYGTLFDSLAQAIARPARTAGPRYNRVSHAFWTAVHDVIARRAEPRARLEELDAELRRIARRARWRAAQGGAGERP